MNVGQQKLGVTKSMTTDQPVLITTEEHLLSAFVHVFHYLFSASWVPSTALGHSLVRTKVLLSWRSHLNLMAVTFYAHLQKSEPGC